MSNLKKTVLITGCSGGGIGDELAKQFHAQGLRVIATARNLSSMDELEALGIETLALDVTDADSIQKTKTRVLELIGGKLDILVNNAGVSYPYAAADLDMAKVKALFEVNVFGAMGMVKQFLPLLIAAGNARIVNMGSLAGVMPVPFGPAYNASKAALHSYSDTLRVELAPFNVKVLSVIAGNVQSQLTKPWHTIPSNSIYQPIQAEYKSRRIDHFHDGAMPRNVIVSHIVAETLKRNPRAWLWDGKNAWLCWFMSTFLGRRAFDGMLSKLFGLSKLAGLLRNDRKNI